MEVEAHYLARSENYRRRGRSCRYEMDRGSFQGLDKPPAIAESDTLSEGTLNII
jgi:hypothetical protein